MAELSFDIAHLTTMDPTHLSAEQVSNEQFLLDHAKESFSQFFTKLNALERVEGTKLALPKAVISLPREKPLPVEKPKTRWEAFVEKKGLKFEEKEKKVLDEATGEWRLRYGYKRANNPEGSWLVEVPFDKTGDPFQEKADKKKENMEEQHKRERRNTRRAAINEAKHAASIGLRGKKTKEEIKAAIDVASDPSSSASMNQFNKVNKKIGIFEKGSTIPKIFDRTKGRAKAEKMDRKDMKRFKTFRGQKGSHDRKGK